jgi:hypothetical protein
MLDTLPISESGGVGMPFREVSAMDQKREFVTFATMEGANIRELCRRSGPTFSPAPSSTTKRNISLGAKDGRPNTSTMAN